MDDAALLHVGAAEGPLVFTLDVITPIVDDARAFGRIAAANSLSDVYAMGGTPQVALSFAGLPGDMGLSLFADVLGGMAEKAQEAGCAIVGGHTIKDTEPKCGLVVIGLVEPGQAWTHKGAQAEQVLVLTKPIGTGVLAQALRAGVIQAEAMAEAIAHMETLNKQARDVGKEYGATAATDVTGFGLLGHLQHMAADSGLDVALDVPSVPLLQGAAEAAKAGCVPGGTKRNFAYVEAHLRGAEDWPEHTRWLLADAQTSGGLMMTMAPDAAQDAVAALPHATIIGRLVKPKESGGIIHLVGGS